MNKILYIIVLHIFLVSCAGFNPNPGERSTDVLWHERKFAKAFSIAERRAKEGYPWAQLRLGIMHELGVGVEKNITEALKWYKKASLQEAEGGWANGQSLGAMGKPGFYNQNSDALIAQYQMANLYLKGEGIEQDIIKAYLYIKNVFEKTEGRTLFYCCEFAGGRYFPASQIKELYENVQKTATSEQLQKAQNLWENWTPKKE